MSQAGTIFTNSGPGGIVQTLTGNTGGPVGPTGGNINTVGSGNITITGNPGTSTLTATVVGTTQHAVQVGNSIGALNSIAVGSTNTALLGNTGADPSFGQVPNAALVNSTITLVSGNSITITGSPVALGGSATVNVSGTTQYSLLLGNSSGSISSLGVATNGQLPIGSTGANPVLATLTAGTGISISNGAGSITISSSGTSTINYTSVTSSPYVVATTDDFLGVTTSSIAITVQLPNAPATGRVYTIKDATGTASTHNITVTTAGGAVTIDGGTTFVMNTNFESIDVLFNGTAYLVY